MTSLAPRFEIIAAATRIGNLAEDLAGSPQAPILLQVERDMRAAVRALDRLPLDPHPLSLTREVAELGKRLEETLASRCPECGCDLICTPGAASRTHDGPRLDLLECTNPVCDFAEAVGDEMEDV